MYTNLEKIFAFPFALKAWEEDGEDMNYGEQAIRADTSSVGCGGPNGSKACDRVTFQRGLESREPRDWKRNTLLNGKV